MYIHPSQTFQCGWPQGRGEEKRIRNGEGSNNKIKQKADFTKTDGKSVPKTSEYAYLNSLNLRFQEQKRKEKIGIASHYISHLHFSYFIITVLLKYTMWPHIFSLSFWKKWETGQKWNSKLQLQKARLKCSMQIKQRNAKWVYFLGVDITYFHNYVCLLYRNHVSKCPRYFQEGQRPIIYIIQKM